MRRVQRFGGVNALESLPPAGDQLCKLALLLGRQLQIAGPAGLPWHTERVAHGTDTSGGRSSLSWTWVPTGGLRLLRPLAVPQSAKGLVLFLL